MMRTWRLARGEDNGSRSYPIVVQGTPTTPIDIWTPTCLAIALKTPTESQFGTPTDSAAEVGRAHRSQLLPMDQFGGQFGTRTNRSLADQPGCVGRKWL